MSRTAVEIAIAAVEHPLGMIATGCMKMFRELGVPAGVSMRLDYSGTDMTLALRLGELEVHRIEIMKGGVLCH